MNNEKLFKKAWDKYREHPEEGWERVTRLACEHFGINTMMTIAGVDIVKDWASINGVTLKEAGESIMSMSEDNAMMVVSDFIYKYTGERPCQV